MIDWLTMIFFLPPLLAQPNTYPEADGIKLQLF